MLTVRGLKTVTKALCREGVIAALRSQGTELGRLYPRGRQDDEPTDITIDTVPGVDVCHVRPLTELGELFLDIVKGEIE